MWLFLTDRSALNRTEMNSGAFMVKAVAWFLYFIVMVMGASMLASLFVDPAKTFNPHGLATVNNEKAKMHWEFTVLTIIHVAISGIMTLLIPLLQYGVVEMPQGLMMRMM